MLAEDSSERITLEEIQQHTWFKEQIASMEEVCNFLNNWEKKTALS